MDEMKIDLDKVRDLANMVSGDVIEYTKEHTIKTAEVLLALNEVIYRYGLFSQIPKDALSPKPLRTPII